MEQTEEAFQEACAAFRTAPDLFRDEDRLHLYALYKQATEKRHAQLIVRMNGEELLICMDNLRNTVN